MPKINDPGGGIQVEGMVTPEAATVGETQESSEELQPGSAAFNGTEGTANLTNANEEVPMPVFSEWAQKQMEAEASRSRPWSWSSRW